MAALGHDKAWILTVPTQAETNGNLKLFPDKEGQIYNCRKSVGFLLV